MNKDGNIVVSVEGSKLISRDVLPGGELGCIKANLGTYKSPEHAAVMAAFFTDPMALLLYATGDITDAHIEQAAMAAQERKRKLVPPLTDIQDKTITAGDRGCKLQRTPSNQWVLLRWDDDTNYDSCIYQPDPDPTLQIFEALERFLRTPFKECKIG